VAAKTVVRRRTDGTIAYRVPFRVTPGSAVTSETFETAEDAEVFRRMLDKVGGQVARSLRTASDNSALDTPTLRTALEEHLTATASSATPGTVAGNRRMAARTWLPALGDLPVDAITKGAVETWVTAQRATETQRSAGARAKAIAAQRKDPTVVIPEPHTYAPKSIRNAHALLSDVLKTSIERGWVHRNVAYKVALPDDHEHEEMTILTENDVVTILGHIQPHYRTLVLTLFGTGLRWGEATALQVGDLNLDAPTPTLRVSRAWKKAALGSAYYLGSPKSKRARRTISLPAQLVPELRALSAGKKADGFVFTTPSKTRIRQSHFWERVWHPAIVAADLGKSPRVHDLRHSHASAMIAEGADLLRVQRRLGHESLKTTGDTYGHLMPDALAEDARIATAMLGGALPQIEA
jgi:integrase